MRGLQIVVIGVASAVLAACQGVDGSIATACPADLQARMDPPAITLRLGDSTRVQATALGCGGTTVLSTSWSWSATDTNIVRVNAGSGWVRGVRSGVTDVVATGGPPYAVVARAVVTVVP